MLVRFPPAGEQRMGSLPLQVARVARRELHVVDFLKREGRDLMKLQRYGSMVNFFQTDADAEDWACTLLRSESINR